MVPGTTLESTGNKYSWGVFPWKDIIIENNKTDLTDLEFSFKIIEEFLVIEK